MKKRMITLAMTLVMALSLAVPAGAAESTEQQISRAVKEAEKYAYLDPETATPDMQEKILDARETIIYNSDWAADGVDVYVEDTETGEIIEKLPSFSEVFPGWEMPMNEMAMDNEYTANIGEPILPKNTSNPSIEWTDYLVDRVYLRKAGNVNASPYNGAFWVPSEHGPWIGIMATNMPRQTWNVGVSDSITGGSIFNRVRLNAGARVYANIGYGRNWNLAFRASTYDNPCYATLITSGGFPKVVQV